MKFSVANFCQIYSIISFHRFRAGFMKLTLVVCIHLLIHVNLELFIQYLCFAEASIVHELHKL